MIKIFEPGGGALLDGGSQPNTRSPTGIKGFDGISRGGLPDNRSTAIIGSPGAGKTVFALQTLVNRLIHSGESGIFVTFEEPTAYIRRNMAAFGWTLSNLSEDGIKFVDAGLRIDTEVSGSFDLAGLLASLSRLKVDSGARSIVFDGIDMLLSGLQNDRSERQELARLNDWVRRSELSVLITVKTTGNSDRDRHRSDYLQYISDCVVLLEGSFTATTSSRTVRIAKYRGSGFAANPVPAVITSTGFNLVAPSGSRSNYPVFTDRVSSGVVRLDALLGGGYLRGSSILISGAPGTSKTSLSANFAEAACRRGENVLFISFDESASQIISHMASIGLDLEQFINAGNLHIASLLSTARTPEDHYIAILGLLDERRPSYLVIDPLSSLLKADYPFTAMVCEGLIDETKVRGVTTLCTSLLDKVSGETEQSASSVATVVDTWIHVSYLPQDGERNRALTIIKSRGSNHSNQVRELVISATGIDLSDVYIADGAVLMGSARLQKEAEVRRKETLRIQEYDHLHLERERDISSLAAQVLEASKELESKQRELRLLEASEAERANHELIASSTRLSFRRQD